MRRRIVLSLMLLFLLSAWAGAECEFTDSFSRGQSRTFHGRNGVDYAVEFYEVVPGTTRLQPGTEEAKFGVNGALSDELRVGEADLVAGAPGSPPLTIKVTAAIDQTSTTFCLTREGGPCETHTLAKGQAGTFSEGGVEYQVELLYVAGELIPDVYDRAKLRINGQTSNLAEGESHTFADDSRLKILELLVSGLQAETTVCFDSGAPPGEAVPTPCADSDGGTNYERQGTCDYNGSRLADECDGSTLLERYCDRQCVTVQAPCSNGCAEGACKMADCRSGDGVCPAQCSTSTDTDCKARACVNDIDCDDRMPETQDICQGATCLHIRKTCTATEQCGPGKRCANGECVWAQTTPPCETNANCPPPAVCVQGRCVGQTLPPQPVRCGSDADCMAPYQCWDGHCALVRPCAVDAECDDADPKSKDLCWDRKCTHMYDGMCEGQGCPPMAMRPCQTDADCFGADRCLDLYCRMPSQWKACKDQADCHEREQCIGGYCMLPPPGARECAEAAACREGEACLMGYCMPAEMVRKMESCVGGDGKCPPFCPPAKDSDCERMAGSPVFSKTPPPPDECQAAADCDDKVACTEDACSGAPKTCTHSRPKGWCELDGTCVPIGTRKADQYCDFDEAAKSQKGKEAACDNSYECQSNLCVDSRCVEWGVFKRLLNWFKGWFG